MNERFKFVVLFTVLCWTVGSKAQINYNADDFWIEVNTNND